MAKKYVKDYRLSDSLDAKGRIRTEYEYIGGSYYRCADSATAAAKSRLLVILCTIGWVCWLLPLLFNNGSMRLAYISFPFIFAALTLWLLSTSAYTAVTAPDPMKHKQSDRLTNMLPGTALATAILSGIALIGTCVSAIFRIGELKSYDWLFGGCAAVVCAVGIIAFSQRKFFRTEER